VKRASAALATAVILVGLIPGTVSAGRVDRGHDHYAFFGCDAPIDGGFVSTFIEHSTLSEFTFATLNVWLDPDEPFVADPTVFGSADAVDLTDDGTTIEVNAVIPTFDQEGNPEGDAELTISVARTGDTRLILPEPGKTNNNDKTNGLEEQLEGSGSLTWDGSEIELPQCSGVVGDIDFFRTNPHAFVTANRGVSINCDWEADPVFAGFFATDDGFGYGADAFLQTSEVSLFTISAPPGSVTESGLDATFELDNSETAVATATFTPVGSPVDSTHVGATFHTKVTEQSLAPDGSIEFSTGDTFQIDDEHCDAVAFESHSTVSQSSGPKARRAPPNDSPEDAIALHVGSRLNTSNVGATPDPEFPIDTCPQGIFDGFGRTLWYSIEGTGGPVTIDTAGSGIDTLIGVYVPTDSGFEEIACIDDVELEPVGSSYQAALTIDTEEGVTYYVQVGGFFRSPFADPTEAEAGRIRIRVR
jgi:hypothetical protein